MVASDTVATFHDAVTNSGTITVLPRGNALFLADAIFLGTALLDLGVGLDGTTDTSAQIGIAGSLTLGGSLTVDVHGGFTPTLGQTFDLITADSVSGTFSTVTVPNIPGILEYRVIYNPTAVRLVVADSTMATLTRRLQRRLRRRRGRLHCLAERDWARSSRRHDYDDSRANFGRTFGSGDVACSTTSNGGVPEPAAAALALVALVGLSLFAEQAVAAAA